MLAGLWPILGGGAVGDQVIGVRPVEAQVDVSTWLDEQRRGRALYFPRHRRRDLVVAYLGVNVGVLVVATALAGGTVAAGLGFADGGC